MAQEVIDSLPNISKIQYIFKRATFGALILHARLWFEFDIGHGTQRGSTEDKMR